MEARRESDAIIAVLALVALLDRGVYRLANDLAGRVASLHVGP